MWPIIYQYAMLMILFLSSSNKLNFIWNTILFLTYFPSILRYLGSFQIAHIILFRSEYMISIKSTLLRKSSISFLSSWSNVWYINDFAVHLIRILKSVSKNEDRMPFYSTYCRWFHWNDRCCYHLSWIVLLLQ
jgi:hypothetical protein